MTQVTTNGFLKPKIHLCNGYFVNFTSLARILNAACQDSQRPLSRADLMTTVGLTEKHVKYLCGITHALGLTRERTYQATPLGHLVHRHDPFFDDVGTLWFLHYVVSSNPHNLVWHRLVTTTLPAHKCITREQANAAFDDLRQTIGGSIKGHITKELNSFFDAYINQHLARLDYLHLDDAAYILNKNSSVPPLVLSACIARFRDRHRSGETAISIPNLLANQNGPGVVLQLEENRFRALLEQLKMEPGFSLESRADLDQIRLTDDMPDYGWMERYYVTLGA